MRRAGYLAISALLSGLLTLAAVGLLSLAAACGDDGEEPGVGATAPADATPAPDIRESDLTQRPELRAFLDASNGEVDPARIIYVDLTEDGVEEAVIPVGSGGEGGDIGVFVYGYNPEGLSRLLDVVTDTPSLAAEIDDAKLLVTEPIYSQSDPFCCPSQLRVTTYAWDGTALAQESSETIAGTPPKTRSRS